MKLLTKRISEIEERIEFLKNISIDDFTASICLAEIENLLAEKMRLEMLTFAHVDIKYAPYYGLVCTHKFDPFKDFINNCHLN